MNICNLGEVWYEAIILCIFVCSNLILIDFLNFKNLGHVLWRIYFIDVYLTAI